MRPLIWRGSVKYIALNFDNGGGAVNQPPTAVLNCSPRSGRSAVRNLGRVHELRSDGTIANYEWDVDGDGVTDVGAGNASSIAQNFGSGGTYHVGVFVTDNLGARTYTAASIYVDSAPAATTRRWLSCGILQRPCR